MSQDAISPADDDAEMDELLDADMRARLAPETFQLLGVVNDEQHDGEPYVFIGHDIFEWFFHERYPSATLRELVCSIVSGCCSNTYYDPQGVAKLHAVVELGIKDATDGLTPRTCVDGSFVPPE